MAEPNRCKYPPVNALRTWLDAATPEVKNMLAELAKASKDMRQQWITGRRAMSAEKAGNLVDAMLIINQQIPDAPIPLSRGDLCAACSKCPHYLREQEEI
jgi:hypothetical protein